MNRADVLQQAINAAKPVKVVALRARREYRKTLLDEKRRREIAQASFDCFYDKTL